MQSHIGCICFTFLHCVLKSKIIFQQQTTSLCAILQLEGHQPHAQGRPLVKLNLQFLTPPLLMEDWQNMIPEQNEKRGVNVSNCGGEKCQIWGGKGTLMGGKCVKIMGGKCAKGKWIMTHPPYRHVNLYIWISCISYHHVNKVLLIIINHSLASSPPYSNSSKYCWTVGVI